jgi:hypothetical protein
MGDSSACARFEELAPEVALGIATGEERAQLLAHAGECDGCAERLEGLSRTADSLLLLSRAEEPPVGFEARVAEAASAGVPRRPRRSRALIALGGLAAGALATVVVLAIALHHERSFSNGYRDTLAEANGEYFTAYGLKAEDGTEAGNAFAYEGRPSWVFVTIDADPASAAPGRYRIQATLQSGRVVPVTGIDVRHGAGSAGHAIDADLDEVTGLRLIGPRGGIAITGTAPPPPPSP